MEVERRMQPMYKITVITTGGSPEDGEYKVKCKEAREFIKRMCRTSEDGCYCYTEDTSNLVIERVAN